MKTYSAQSGYVYQYYYEGRRDLPSSDPGAEFVFSISADRKIWKPTSVHVSRAALLAWEQPHARELSSTEHYAIAKMALFQAFDERAEPAQLEAEVHVRAADVETIIETLGL
jgi:hypothetical protein